MSKYFTSTEKFIPHLPTGTEEKINSIINGMTIDQKIGQLMTFEFCGTRLTPDVIRAVRDYHCGGLRVTPHVYSALPYHMRHRTEDNLGEHRSAPYACPDEYATCLNAVQKLAAERNLSVPLHISIDQEGDWSQDYSWGGVSLFPSPMGIAATGDLNLAYAAYRAVGMQLKAVGANMIHTPCLDVNTNPDNPEICTRSFGDTPESVAQFGVAQFKAFRDAGIIATGKHFPGRGDSAVDVHFSLDTHKGDKKRLEEVELLPYRELIKAGLPAIMSAHTIYPSLDPSNTPASVSRRVITDFLRDEMGFNGVITTDAMGMKGVVNLYESFGEACAASIAAGNDLVLAKGDPELQVTVIDAVHRYLDEGKIDEKQINDSVRRILRMKIEYGIIDAPFVDENNARDNIRFPEIIEICTEVARSCLHVVRDEDKLLPLSRDAKVFITDQYNWPYHNKGTDYYYHSHMLPEFCREKASNPLNITSWESNLTPTKDDIEISCRMADEADVVIALTFFWRSLPTNTELVKTLLAKGKPLILISNCPYEKVALPESKNLILTYSCMPQSLKAAIDLIYGDISAAKAVWPLNNYPIRGV